MDNQWSFNTSWTTIFHLWSIPQQAAPTDVTRFIFPVINWQWEWPASLQGPSDWINWHLRLVIGDNVLLWVDNAEVICPVEIPISTEGPPTPTLLTTDNKITAQLIPDRITAIWRWWIISGYGVPLEWRNTCNVISHLQQWACPHDSLSVWFVTI